MKTQTNFLLLLVLFIFGFALQSHAFKGEPNPRFDRYSVLPFVDFEPGFTRDANQVFTLKLAGIGRESITLNQVRINDKAVPRNGWRIENGVLTVPSNPSLLKQGANTFEIRYSHPSDGKHDGETIVFRSIVNYQPDSAEITLGERGELIVNGEPRFVIGSYRSGQTDDFIQALPTAVKAGFTMVHDYSLESTRTNVVGVEDYIRRARQYLQAAHQHGLGVFLGFPRQAVRTYNEEHLVRIITELSNEPALHIWYLMDEPTYDSVPILHAAQLYQLLQRLDPNRPSVYLLNQATPTLIYSPFCDMIWWDRYPVIATSTVLSSLAPIAASLQQGFAIKGHNRPLWPTLQVHDNKGYLTHKGRVDNLPKVTDDNHWPTVEHIRAQSHLAIAAGCMALTYYWGPPSWYSMKTDTPLYWKGFSEVVQEIGQLTPILLSEDSPEFRVEGGNEKIMVWSRSYEGNDYYGVVNLSLNHSAQTTLLPSVLRGKAQMVQGSGSITVSNDRIRINLPTAGVVVIQVENP